MPKFSSTVLAWRRDDQTWSRFEVSHHERLRHSISKCPTRQELAIGMRDGRIQFVDSETGSQLADLRGHAGVVSGIAWSPDGKRIASIGSDGLLKIWDSVNRTELLAFNASGGRQFGRVKWSKDGRRLAAVCGNELHVFGSHRIKRIETIADAVAAYNKRLDELPLDRRFLSERELYIQEILQTYPSRFAKLVELRPNDTHLRAVEAREYVKRCDWRRAADIYAGIIESVPPGGEWYEHAALRLLIGDKEGHRRFVRKMSQQLGQTKDHDIVRIVARSAALTSEQLLPDDDLSRLANLALADGKRAWQVHVAALGLLRLGRYKQAHERFTESLAIQWTQLGHANNYLGMALVNHYLNQPQKAQEWLMQADAWLNTVESSDGDTRNQLHAPDWLELNLLRAELDRVIPKK